MRRLVDSRARKWGAMLIDPVPFDLPRPIASESFTDPDLAIARLE